MNMPTSAINHLAGLIITGFVLILIGWFVFFIKKPIEKIKLRWSIIAIISAFVLSWILSYFFTRAPSEGDATILFWVTVIFAPSLEEFLNRRILFQILLDAQKYSWKLHIIAISSALALYVGPGIFYLMGWISNAPRLAAPGVFIFLYGAIVVMNTFPGKLSPKISLIIALMGQAIIFGLIHLEPSWSNIITGVLFGSLYYFSGKLWPATLAHGITNLYVNFLM